MIKTLKRQFIITAMVAVTILMLAIVIVQNISNYSFMNSHSQRILDDLAAQFAINPEFDPETDYVPSLGAESSGNEAADGSDVPSEPEELGGQVHFGFNYPDMYDNDILRSAYFTVVISPSTGEILNTDVSRIADVDEEKAQDYASTMFHLKRYSGWYDVYKYTSVNTPTNDLIFIFLNRQTELNTQKREILISILLVAGCFILMLLLVMFLANRIIKPIAANFEKQKDFITYAGHSIKTPLAIIQANTEALVLYNGENKWTRNIKDQTTRLTNLMTNMLTLSRAEGTLDPSTITDVDLNRLIREILPIYRESLAGRKLSATTSLEEGLVVKGEPRMINQVLTVMLNNAIKYARDNTQIEIRASQKDKGVVLEFENVTDYLPDCEPDKLFERFYRPDSTRYSEQSGNGIGLSAAKAIMETIGGSISCKYKDSDRIIFSMTFRR